MVENKEEVEKASLPVEKIQSAILLITGIKDVMLLSTQMSKQIMSRLAINGFAHPYAHHV